MLRNATWTLSNFCRGKPQVKYLLAVYHELSSLHVGSPYVHSLSQPPFALIEPALPTLAYLLYQSDIEVLTDTCWALSYVSDGSNDKIAAVIESGIFRVYV